jgi:hypothetical protein
LNVVGGHNIHSWISPVKGEEKNFPQQSATRAAKGPHKPAQLLFGCQQELGLWDDKILDFWIFGFLESQMGII